MAWPRMLKRASIAVTAALGMVAPTVGCTTHQCDSDSVTMPPDAGTLFSSTNGDVVWESGPATGPWLDFPGQRTFRFQFPRPLGTSIVPLAYVATDPGDADSSPQNSVNGVGQLAEFLDVSSTGLTVVNASCQRFFLRVVVLSLGQSDGGAGSLQPGLTSSAVAP